jgi:hypothetical protein
MVAVYFAQHRGVGLKFLVLVFTRLRRGYQVSISTSIFDF